MVKILLSILLISVFISCSTSNQSIEQVDSQKEELKRKMFYFENYPVVNSSYKEDIVLLSEDHLAVLKNLFDNNIKMSLKENKYEISVKENTNYSIIISNFEFKEFKIQVDGPELNIITLKVDYKLKAGAFEKVLFEEINKESLEPFDQLICQEMCHTAANNIITKVNSISIR